MFVVFSRYWTQFTSLTRLLREFRHFGQIENIKGDVLRRLFVLRTNKTAMRVGTMRQAEGLITGTPALEPFGTGVFLVVSSLYSLPSVEQMIWLENNGFPLTTPLSELAPAHHAVYQLTKPLRRLDALRRAAMATSVVVIVAKLFENSPSVSTAASFSQLKTRRP